MGKIGKLRAAMIGALALSGLPSAAQEGGVTAQIGFNQRFEINDNFDLDVDSPGTTVLSTSSLSFDWASVTRSQQLRFGTSTALRYVLRPGGGHDTEIDDPQLRLSYRREAANAALSARANYRRSQIEFVRPLEDFTDEEGELDLPEDVDDLEGTGIRQSLSLSGQLSLGTQGPLGITLSAGVRDLQYEDVTDPDLFDTRRVTLGATANAQISPAITGRLSVSGSRFEAEDAENTRRDTISVTTGAEFLMPGDGTLDLSFGYTVIETEEFGVTSRDEGFEAAAGFSFAVINGSAGVNASLSQTSDGARVRLSGSRSLELPNGSLGFSLGVTQLDDGDPSVTARVNWAQRLPEGRLNASLTRDVAVTNDDEERISTQGSIGWGYDINPVSSLSLRLTGSLQEETADDPQVTRANFTATYSRALTRDWNLNVGFTHRYRDEQGEGVAQSNAVFVGLGRNFDLRF